MTSEWSDLANIYTRMGAPMRPCQLDIDRVKALIAGHDGNVLLLGATPEYAPLGRRLTAIDGTARMISDYWRHEDASRRAILGDWLNMPFEDGEFTALMGDGSLGSAAHGLADLLPELRRVLMKDGVAVFRTFCAPEEAETIDDIVGDYFTHPDANALCLRLRMAMAMTADQPDHARPIRDLAFMFDNYFPDRALLAEKTGWSMDEIDRIDSMKTAEYSVGFPARSFLRGLAEKHFTDIRFVESDGYPLADRCPIVVLR